LSPEQVAGRIPLETGDTISHEAIYQWIYTEARELIRYLHRGRPKRVSRRYRKHSRPRIPGRISILERPAVVETRTESGHWEVDTIHSRGGEAVLVILTERKTRLVKLSYLPRRTALGVDTAIVRRLSQYPASLRRTLTYDNGTENSQHQKTNATLGTQSFFCHPQHGWEKGTVENSVGLVRRFFPKGTNFDQVTSEEVKWVERRLNRRPRKCLQFLTPTEAFRQERCT
jgi:IS30 family transposase